MSWLWTDMDGTFLIVCVEPDKECGAAVDAFDAEGGEEEWVLVGHPHTGMLLYRRAGWADRLLRWYRHRTGAA